MSLRAPVVFSENPGSKLLPQRGSPSPARGWQAHPGIGRRVCFPWKPRMPQRKPSTGQQRPALLSSVLNFGSAFGPAPCSCGAPLRERATLGPMRAGGSRKPPDMPRSGRRGLSCRWAKHGPPVGRMLFASKGRKKRRVSFLQSLQSFTLARRNAETNWAGCIFLFKMHHRRLFFRKSPKNKMSRRWVSGRAVKSGRL